jgi:pimeloyl-ACP methyl ester carboxylesterase
MFWMQFIRLLLTTLALIFIGLIFLSCQQQSESPAAGTAASADGVSIQYQVAGAGAPALLFVHCWCCDHSFWDAQAPHFAEKYKVVTLDLGGHGDSGQKREHWSIPAFGQDGVAVVEQLNLDQVVLIGHSMGGPVILEAARRMPERVIGLVGVDNFHDMDERYSEEQFEEFLRPMRANFKEATENFVRTMFPVTADSELVERVISDMSSAPPEVGVGAMEAIFHWYRDDFLTVSQEIKAPLRCINSDFYPTNVEANRRYFPSFEVSIMPGVGHFVQMEDSETFNRLLEEAVEDFTSAAMRGPQARDEG